MPNRDVAPFFVFRSTVARRWVLSSRHDSRFLGWFDTQAEAIDYAYKNWPWWP